MINPDVIITDEFVFVDGENIPIEEWSFEECPMTQELLEIVITSSQ